MSIACRLKVANGRDFCLASCPTAAEGSAYRYVRVERADDLPPPLASAVDVAILDMNHGWPNLGHDSLVHAVQDAVCDLLPGLERVGLVVRALSFDVRRGLVIPDAPGGRFALYLGTGGPGELDPRLNDGVSPGSQGVDEDPSWEPRLFALFDAIAADREAALIAVCHTFGVMCRWAGAADAVLRGPEKGGKSSGILENLLTPEAQRHPWFRRFAQELPEHRRLRVVDNRLFDLIPEPLPAGMTPIAFETRGVGGPAGDALTMLEFARDAGGMMPRVFGVNHHPEIVDRGRQMLILRQKLERGEVTQAWCDERIEILTRTYPDENSDLRLRLTSDYTLLAPLRFHLERQIRRRAESLGLPWQMHEDRILESAAVGPHA